MRTVWDVIADRVAQGSRPRHRADGLKAVLAIEGGGMRGTVSAGMALALHRRGILGAFDAVYGSSAGSITGAWLLSSDPEGLRGWADPRWAAQLIGVHNLARRKPFVDVSRLIDDVYLRQFPLDYASVVDSAIPLHPLATSATTGRSVDLRALIETPAHLRTAIRASCALPVAAGGPIPFGADLYTDAGLAESVPILTPAVAGATHVLVLRTRPPSYVRPKPPVGLARSAAVLALRMTGHGPAVAQALFSRAERARLDDERLRGGVMQGPAQLVRLATVWPDRDAALPSRLERDGDRLRAGFRAGKEAFERSFEERITDYR